MDGRLKPIVSDPALYYADRVPKPRKRAQRRDPRRRAETTLAAPLPAAGGAPAHDVGALIVLSLEATVPGVGRFTFSAPSAAQLLLTAARQRAKDADTLRVRVFRKRRMVPSPRGLAPSLREPDVFPFLQAAMAAVILGYTALETLTTETLPDDFSIPDPKTGKELSREAVEGRGLELRLSAVMARHTGRPNLMTDNPRLWSQCLRLKTLREALGHLKAARAFAPSSATATGPPDTVWADLLSVQSYEKDVIEVVQAVMDHYRVVAAPSSGTPDSRSETP